jgi:hypothetical protein
MRTSATRLVTRIVASACLTLSATPAVGQVPGSTHVRAFDPILRGLLDEGIDRSATFRGLVTQIDQTDGIVYVQNGSCSVGAAIGCLVMAVREAGHTRYLRIHVPARRLRRDDHIALIGHELQHASEVLAARWVRNTADARSLFVRIGWADSIRSFETAEAQRIGEVIRHELAVRARNRR